VDSQVLLGIAANFVPTFCCQVEKISRDKRLENARTKIPGALANIREPIGQKLLPRFRRMALLLSDLELRITGYDYSTIVQ
jgi:hypothetical protein